MNNTQPQPATSVITKNNNTKRAVLISVIVVGAFMLLISLPSLLFSSRTDTTCVNLKTDTALAVPGVEGSFEHGSVVVNASTTDEAMKIMDAVYLAFALKPGMVATWNAPTDFTSQDGSIVVHPRALGFNGTPWISDLRKHYNVNETGN
jgi:hypothetical protein